MKQLLPVFAMALMVLGFAAVPAHADDADAQDSSSDQSQQQESDSDEFVY